VRDLRVLEEFINAIKPASKCPHKQIIRKTSRFKVAIVGGTFDLFHIAHAALLTTAFESSEKTYICIMSDEGVRTLHEKKHEVEQFATRKEKVHRFIQHIQRFDKIVTEIYKIDDPFSFAITGEKAKEITALIVGNEKKPLERSRRLNELRAQHGLNELKILRLPLIIDEKGEIISTTRIRSQCKLTYMTAPELKITNALRNKLKKPQANFAKSIEELPDAKYVVAIGDVITKSLIEHNYGISIGVIDRRVGRKKITNDVFFLQKEKNELIMVPHLPLINIPGTISGVSWYIFKLAFSQNFPVIIRVFGEEDLLGFPAVLLAPKNTLIIYGQPFDSGIVYAFADEVREKVAELLMEMNVQNIVEVTYTRFM